MKKTVAESSIWSLISTGVRLFGYFLLGLIIPLFMVPSQYGVYSYLTVLTTNLILFATMGLLHGTQKFISEESDIYKKRTTFKFLNKIAIVQIALVSIVLIISRPIINQISDIWYLDILIIATFLFGALGLLDAAKLKASKEFREVAISEIMSQSMRIIAFLCCIFAINPLNSVVAYSFETIYRGVYWIKLRISRIKQSKKINSYYHPSVYRFKGFWTQGQIHLWRLFASLI